MPSSPPSRISKNPHRILKESWKSPRLQNPMTVDTTGCRTWWYWILLVAEPGDIGYKWLQNPMAVVISPLVAEPDGWGYQWLQNPMIPDITGCRTGWRWIQVVAEPDDTEYYWLQNPTAVDISGCRTRWYRILLVAEPGDAGYKWLRNPTNGISAVSSRQFE